MKVGPYCGYSLDEIINIKMEEQKKIGKFFWGYSGVFCRPNVVNNLVSYANKEKIKVLFVETISNFIPATVDRFTHFSKDSNIWEEIPKEVLLVGNRNRPHFAICANNLEKVDMELDLSRYVTLKGMFPNEDQRFDKYFKYRVDKACGVINKTDDVSPKLIKVRYISELVEPYSVYIK